MQRIKSDTQMDVLLKSKLESLQLKEGKKKKKEEAKKGIAKYLCEDSDSSNDSLNDDEDGDDDLAGGQYLGGKSIMKAEDNNPQKLIDMELLNLLKFCGDLFEKYKGNNEDYAEEIMLKSIELGKKTKQKVLVLDMDETMVSARFKNKMPEGF